MQLVLRFGRLKLPMEWLQLKDYKDDYSLWNKFIGNNSMVSTLPWGSMVMICSEETADDVPRSAGSAICLETSVGVSCGWGAGWWGEVASLVILDEEERMVLSSGALAGSWYFWDPFSWSELGWAGGHRHLTFEHFWSWSICQFAVTTTKISWVKI